MTTILYTPAAHRSEEETIRVRIFDPPEPVRFAKGGLARAAEAVRAAGAPDDEILIHLTRQEFNELRRAWGEPTYNPITGLPEYSFLKRLGNKVGNFAKRVVKNPIFQTVAPIAASIFLPGVGGLIAQSLMGAATSKVKGGNPLTGALTGSLGHFIGGGKLGAGGDKTLNLVSGEGKGPLARIFGGGGGGAGMSSEAVENAMHGGTGPLSKIKGFFTNPETGKPAWGKILGTGAGALSLLGSMGGHEEPTQAPTLNAGPPLRRLELNRTVTGLPSDADYFKYGQSGGEHQFFSNNQLPPMRAGGHYIKGPGTGRSDDIDAKLSNDEYVMDAETVALLGDGSPEAGAQRLDELRANIRKHKGRELAKGKFSANAKRPEEYLRKAKGGRIKGAFPNMDKSTAYRGYYIKHNTMRGEFYISKDNFNIGGAHTSVEDAKKTIDEVIGDEPIKKAKGGRIRGDWVRRVVEGAGGVRAPLNDAERKAQLAAVQRFRDALKKPDEESKPKLTLVKAKGGAVENLTKFATELETALHSGQRAAELEQQLDTLGPGTAQFFKDGFAKGGKAPSLIEELVKRNRSVDTSEIAKELRKLKPESDVLRSFEAMQRNKKPLLRDPEALKLLEAE